MITITITIMITIMIMTIIVSNTPSSEEFPQLIGDT